MSEEEALATVILRLTPAVDSQFRDRLRRKGDLVTLLQMILQEVDLGEVPVAPISFTNGKQSTSVKLPKAEYDRIKRYAATRTVSTNALINAAIQAFLNQESTLKGSRKKGR